MHGEGHARASSDLDPGRWASDPGQPPSHLLLHQQWRPRGQPSQHQPDPGAWWRGVPLQLQQLRRDRFLPGANKRKRCLSDQLFQHIITYTHKHVLIYSVSICSNWHCSLTVSEFSCWFLLRSVYVWSNKKEFSNCYLVPANITDVSALTLWILCFLSNACWQLHIWHH